MDFNGPDQQDAVAVFVQQVLAAQGRIDATCCPSCSSSSVKDARLTDGIPAAEMSRWGLSGVAGLSDPAPCRGDAGVQVQVQVQGDSAAPESLRRYFAKGLVANAINPKIVLFFLSFLPQFVAASRGHMEWQLGLLGLLFTAQAAIFSGAGSAREVDELANPPPR